MRVIFLSWSQSLAPHYYTSIYAWKLLCAFTSKSHKTDAPVSSPKLSRRKDRNTRELFKGSYEEIKMAIISSKSITTYRYFSKDLQTIQQRFQHYTTVSAVGLLLHLSLRWECRRHRNQNGNGRQDDKETCFISRHFFSTKVKRCVQVLVKL